MQDSTTGDGANTGAGLLKGENGRYILLLLVLGLVIRFVPAYLVYGSNDVGAWRLVIREFNMGNNPYLTKKLNWPPLWPTMLLYTGRVQTVYGLPDYFAVKVVPILVDASIAIALYVWFIQGSADPRSAFRRALWYALNPVAIFTCAFHGQFDCLPAFFSLLAVMALERARTTAAALQSAFWLNLGIMSRTWPVVLLPILLGHVRPLSRKLLFIALALVPTVVSLYILYLQAPAAIMDNVIRYQGSNSNWGFDAVSVFLPHHVGVTMRRLMLCVLYAAWIVLYIVAWRKRLPLTPTAILGVLTYYVFSPGIGGQHLEWMVPFAVFADFRRMRLYTLIAGTAIAVVYIFSPYNGEHFGFLKRTRTALFWQTNVGHHHQVMGMLNMFPVWLFCLWWYASLWRETLRASPDQIAASEQIQDPSAMQQDVASPQP